jgi:cytochrome c556
MMLRRFVLVAMVTALVAAPLARLQAQPVDRRQRIVVPAAARDRVLAEMRAMLESVNGVLRGLSSGDRAAAEKAARAAGLATAADVQPEVKRALPPPFLSLGMQTHRAFDRLADELRGGASGEAVLTTLAEVTSLCVACHAAYRLDAAP